jgi:excisionase family DNA binding protein
MIMATIQIDGVEYLRTDEAAERLGVSTEMVNKAVQRGRLKRKKLGFYNLFESDELERYLRENRNKRGRKPAGADCQEKN